MFVFLSSFASYLLKMAVLVALALIGATIGIQLRKSKNRKEESLNDVVEDSEK